MDLDNQYMEIVHNNTKHISNMEVHIFMMDMHTFFHSHVRCCFEYMLTMWNDTILSSHVINLRSILLSPRKEPLWYVPSLYLAIKLGSIH